MRKFLLQMLFSVFIKCAKIRSTFTLTFKWIACCPDFQSFEYNSNIYSLINLSRKERKLVKHLKSKWEIRRELRRAQTEYVQLKPFNESAFFLVDINGK